MSAQQPAQAAPAPQAPAHAYTFKINEFDGDVATRFFTSDFHLDNTISTNLKLGLSTPGTAFKLTFNTKPGKTTTTSTEGTFTFPISEQWSSNGHPLSSELKFKPKAFVQTFSYNPILLKGANNTHWINPYIVLNVPTTFSDLNKDSVASFGAVLHINGESVKSVLNNQTSIARSGDDYKFSVVANNLMTWKNFKISSINKLNLARGEKWTKTNSVSVGANFQNLWANLVFENKGEGENTIGLGLKQKVNEKLTVAAQRWQELSTDGLGEATHDFGVEYNHCPGFQTKAVLTNLKTLGFWANFAPKSKKWSASACYDRQIKGDEFNWGLKLNYNI